MVNPISITTPFRVQKVTPYIPTKQYHGKFAKNYLAREVGDKNKAAIEAGIRELREKQRVDPERYIVDQCASKIRQCFTSTANKKYNVALQSSPLSDGKDAPDYDDAAVGGNKEEGKIKMKYRLSGINA